MKTTSIVARYLLGLMFTVFGLNGFLNFIHQPPPTNPLALQFFGAIVASHFAAFLFAGQVFGAKCMIHDTALEWRNRRFSKRFE